MAYKYSYQKEKENVSRAVLRDAPVSPKQAIEICAILRNKKVEYAKRYLEEVIAEKRAVPFSRFTAGAGHKAGIGPGKYPIKTAQNVLKIVNSVEANANAAGLSSDLKIVHLSAQRASAPWHMGRQSRRRMKRTHLEIAVQEIEKKPKKETKKFESNNSKEVNENKPEVKETIINNSKEAKPKND